MTRTAIVLFNLGGPDSPAAVEPFLFNLFNDPAIIGAPAPVRWLLAKFISKRRGPVAREIYGHLGGGSPLLPNTEAQAASLERALADLGEVRCFIAMRYWRPRALEAARAVKDFAPDRVVLLPLYPQYSTTTSGSSFGDWEAAVRGVALAAPTHRLCCYPRDSGFVAAVSGMVRAAYGEAQTQGRPRILFSAHGLPKRVTGKGDPYQWQVEQSVSAVAGSLADLSPDYVVCYQSRVGPLEWIGPSTEDEIVRAGRDRVPVLVVPIAFVSEHSETLVELDIEYRKLAEAHGVPAYHRVGTVATAPDFIAGLAVRVRAAVEESKPVRTGEGDRICPHQWSRCYMTGSR